MQSLIACNSTIRQTPGLGFLTLRDLRFLLFKKNSEQEVAEITEKCGMPIAVNPQSADGLYALSAFLFV